MENYIYVFKNFSNFTGRARRKEYWMFALFQFIIGLLLMAIIFSFGFNAEDPTLNFGVILYLLFALVSFLPGLAVAVRRLHDAGKSGWMYLIALIPFIGAIWLLVLLVMDSQPGTNKWGPNPKEDNNLDLIEEIGQ